MRQTHTSAPPLRRSPHNASLGFRQSRVDDLARLTFATRTASSRNVMRRPDNLRPRDRRGEHGRGIPVRSPTAVPGFERVDETSAGVAVLPRSRTVTFRERLPVTKPVRGLIVGQIRRSSGSHSMWDVRACLAIFCIPCGVSRWR